MGKELLEPIGWGRVIRGKKSVERWRHRADGTRYAQRSRRRANQVTSRIVAEGCLGETEAAKCDGNMCVSV